MVPIQSRSVFKKPCPGLSGEAWQGQKKGFCHYCLEIFNVRTDQDPDVCPECQETFEAEGENPKEKN